MTPPFPFAGTPVPRDASRSTSPRDRDLASPDAGPPSGVGAFSSRRARTSRERVGEIEAQVDKIRAMAGKGMTYKEIAEVYDVSSNTISRICARHDIGERIRRVPVEPKKMPRVDAAPAIGPASMSFVDDAAAVADCGSRYIPRRPDLHSYMGCAAQMVVASRMR